MFKEGTKIINIMNKKAEVEKMGMLIILFVGAIIGVTFILTTGNSIEPLINTDTNINETLNIGLALFNGSYLDGIDYSYGFNLSHSDVSSVTSIFNSTTGNATQLTVDVDYTVNITPMNLYFHNTTLVNNLTMNGNESVVTYDYFPDDYIHSRSARTLTKLILLFFALSVRL